MKDWHVHIGQYFEEYYDYHNVFSAVKDNGINEIVLAYLTPRFIDEKNAVDFFLAVEEELNYAVQFAKGIELKVSCLYWADPLVLKIITLEQIFSNFPYSGIAIHPIVHDWVKLFPEMLSEIFDFSRKQRLPIFIHTGESESDRPIIFEKWFIDFPEVEVHLAHCKDSKSIIELFSKYQNLWGDTAFCPKDSYNAICNAGFQHRMYFGTDFPITHYYYNKHSSTKRTLAEQYKIDCFSYDEVP